MAVVIKKHKLEASENNGLPQPIIFCQPDPALEDMAVSLNSLT